MGLDLARPTANIVLTDTQNEVNIKESIMSKN